MLMNKDVIKEILNSVSKGNLSVEDALEQLKTLPYKDLGTY